MVPTTIPTCLTPRPRENTCRRYKNQHVLFAPLHVVLLSNVHLFFYILFLLNFDLIDVIFHHPLSHLHSLLSCLALICSICRSYCRMSILENFLHLFWNQFFFISLYVAFASKYLKVIDCCRSIFPQLIRCFITICYK
jgi:hypothetical protein